MVSVTGYLDEGIVDITTDDAGQSIGIGVNEIEPLVDMLLHLLWLHQQGVRGLVGPTSA